MARTTIRLPETEELSSDWWELLHPEDRTLATMETLALLVVQAPRKTLCKTRLIPVDDPPAWMLYNPPPWLL